MDQKSATLKCPMCGKIFVGEAVHRITARRRAQEQLDNHICSEKTLAKGRSHNVYEKGSRGGKQEKTKKDSPHQKGSNTTKKMF